MGDTALDPASLANADIALSGDGVTDAAGARTVVADPTRGPELLADGETVRYYLTGAFEKGRVQVDWADGAWRDTAGDASVAGSGSFHLIEALEASDAAVPEKIFFIDISGGLELRLADVFDENILEIRGKVSLEIGNVTIDGRKVFRFKLDASGTIKVIKLGNIASGAATFVLQSSGGLSDLEFWGVATFATNLSFLEQYGIFLQGSVLLQVNTTGTTKTETLSLEGIPGGTAFLLPVAGAPPLPSGTFSPAPLDAAWIAKLKTPGTNRDLDANDATSAYTLNTGQTHQLQPGFTGVDLTGRNPTVEGLVAGKKWRIKTNDGRYFFIERETLLNGTDVYVVRTEERVYDLAPRSVVFEIVGGARIVDPSTLNRPKADQTVWFELYGGFRIELNPRRFELFITAGGSVKALGSLSGRLIGLLIVEVDPPHAGEPGFDANALPGVAGMLSLELDASLGGGDTGLSDVDDFFSFEAKVKITLNTTRREQVFTVPPSFLDVLPSDFPSTITIFESMPNLRGDAELNPASDGAFYVQGNISGSIRLANVLTLAGFLSFTASTEGVRIAGAVSGEIQYVGAVSGSLDLLFLTAGPEIVGRVTLFVSRGAGNLKMSGALLVEVNSTGGDYVLETFLVKKDDANPPMAPDDPSQYQLSDHDAGDPPGIDIGDVTIAAGFRIFLGGKIEVGPLEVSGSFTIEINPTFVQFTAVAKLKLGDIGQLNFTGAMRFDADGLVINTTISLAAGSGFGSAIDLDISGSITFQLNTSNKVKNVGGLVDPGFRFRIQAAVTFIGFADATGVIEISINQDKFELYFDVAIALGPITVRATGFAGVYADGLVLYLDVALDVNLLEIVKMKASGKLRLNTTAAPKTIPGGISIDVGFRLAMTGELKVLEVITLQATFVMQVGGTGAGVQVCTGGASICNDPDSGIGHVEQLSKGDWFISLTATADFFGLASMSASGWIDSKGHFGLRLHGEMVLGSRSFGLVGEFTFSVLLKEETNPANGLTEYHFRVFFSADVDARLFGITFAGVGLSASVEARGAGGEVDLVASVTVRIKILFIRISKTVRFKIGTIQLPKQVYLAGEGPSATVGTALWRGATTPQALYLNMGQRAQAAGDFTGRGIGDSNASEIFIIEHVGGTAGNETLRVKGMGREKTYVGVTMLYAYAGNGSDTIIVREGVLVNVHLEGGAGRDVILFSGSGNAVICGDRCSGTAAGVEGTPVHEDDDSDSSTPAENDDENPAVNDTPEPGDDAIEIGLKAGGGPDTRTIVVHGDGGDDYLSYLGTGSAQLYGDDGDDVVTGGPGADVLDGGAGSDEITGGGGLDTITGGIGNDVIKLGLPTAANFPRIEAGEGSDVLIVTATDGNDNLGISDPDGGDDIQIAKLGAPDQRLLANDVEELVVDLGPGADTVIVTSLHGSSVENVTINAGKVVTKLGEHLIDDPDEADPSRKILAPIFNIADDGATDVIRIAGREATDDTFNLSGIVSGEAGAGTVDGIRVAHVGVADFYISNTKRAGENDRVVIQGLSGDDVLDAASLGDTDVLAAPVYPDLAVIELDGGDGKDRLIGSPFADVLRSGTGDDTVTGGLGRDTFFDEGGFDTLVEVQNADMTLFDDRFVVGSLRNDADTGPFASSSYQNEAFLIDAIRTGVNPSFRNFGSGDRYAAGATVEEIKGIFEQAYLTGGEANNTLAVSDPDNVFYVGGIAQTGNPWRGRAVLDAKGSDGAAPEHYLITIALDSHARIEIADTGGAAGVDRLILFGTNQADVFTLDATGSGAFRVGIVQASEVSQQRVTFRGMERVEVYTFEGADRILTDDTAATTVIDMGAGDDEIVIGTVPLIPDPGNRTLEFPDGVPVADTENMTNGNSNPLFVLGGDQNDRFEVNTNKAKLWLHGGNGNDRFLLKTFLVLKENADDPNDITNLASLFGGAGANRYDYLQNAPVFINGGAGVDTIVVVGTPIGDVFVVTDAYVAGAGRLVTFTNVEAVEVDGAGGDDTIYVLSTGEHFETIVTGGSGNDTIHVGGDAPTLVFDPPPFEYTPPPFLVSLPPELVYDTIPLNLDNFTFRVPLGEWLARGGQLIPNGQTGDPVAEAAGMAVLQGFISRWAQSLGLLGSSVLLELTEVGGITARPRWNFFFSFLFDPTIEVTVSTLRLNLKIGRMEERTQLVQPPKTIVDPQPFALDAGRNLDISKILNRLTIRGGDQFETAGVGDRVVVHNEEGRAATGKLFVRKTVRRKANGEIGGVPVFTFDLDAQGNKQYDSYLTLQGGGLGIDAGSVSADGTEYDGVEMTGIEQLDLRLADGDGTAGNTGRDDFTVLSTPAGLNLTIWAGGGDDTVRIHGIGGQTTVAGGAGNDLVEVRTVADGVDNDGDLAIDEADELNAISGVLGRLIVDGENGIMEESVPVLDTDPLVRDFIGVPMIVEKGAGPFTFNSSGGPVQYYAGRFVAILEDPDGIAGNGSALRVRTIRISATGDLTSLNIHEQGVLERATQKRDGAGQALWFDTGGGETTDSSKTGVPVLVAGTESQVYVDLDFNKVLSPWGRNQLSNGAFGEFVPSSDTGGGWTSSRIDDGGGWRQTSSSLSLGGSFILNDNGDAATNPTLTQSLGAIRAGVLYRVTGRFQQHAGGDANSTAGFLVTLTGAALSAVTYGALVDGWRTFSATFVGGSGPHSLSIAAEVGNDISYRVDDVAVQAENLVSYATRFGDPAGVELYIDGSGRKVAQATGNRPSVIPVDDVVMSDFVRVRDVVVEGAGGNDRLLVESSSIGTGLDVTLDTYYLPVNVLQSGMPVTYGARHRELPPARQPRGQGLLRRRDGARPVHRRGAHLPGRRRPHRLRPLQPGPHAGARPVRQPAHLRDRRRHPPHRRRPGHPAPRPPAGLAGRRARVRRAAQRGVHGLDALPLRARPGQALQPRRAALRPRRGLRLQHGERVQQPRRRPPRRSPAGISTPRRASPGPPASPPARSST